MEICTIYTHEADMAQVVTLLKNLLGDKAVKVSGNNEQWEEINITLGRKFLRAGNTVTFTYRQRETPGYRLLHTNEPVMTNLLGMYNYVQQLPADNPELKQALLAKIATINTELSVQAVPAFNGELRSIVMEVARQLDAFIFSGKNFIFDTAGQGFWDKTGALLLDTSGHSTATELPVNISAIYFDQEHLVHTMSPAAAARKERSEKLLQSAGARINFHLPAIEDEQRTRLRSVREVAERVAVLAAVNAAAFGHLTGDQVTSYLQKFHLWDKTTPNERQFLWDITPEQQTRETWKCEDIWVLLWALHKLPSLGNPDALCNLDMVAVDDYPFRGLDKDPADFINHSQQLRTATEILDAGDFYYRADWACVESRIRGESPVSLHPGVVYERHYALNWLVRYKNQEWDEVTCDT